ncbi:MAG: diguanylate cyclase, partial [Actinobacteria bacterium]|nr:diguanylate cyclase [Actinomycetota bacterium]
MGAALYSSATNDGQTPCHVLLVEDNDSDARLIGILLARSRPTAVVTRCPSVGEALEQRTSEFAVILTDLNLPDSAGADTVSRLATAFVGTPIVALTTDDALGLECISVGAQDFIPKTELTAGALRRAVDFSIGRATQIRQTEIASRQDSLTGLLNRAAFDEAAQALLTQLGEERLPFVIFFDINSFKDINDVHGHATGDAVLIAVAEKLRATVRAQDIVCRWGGDEFTV